MASFNKTGIGFLNFNILIERESEKIVIMDEGRDSLACSCEFSGIKPVMVELPYPPVKVRNENLTYANLLSIDYCGAVSEMTAITQYINHENRLAASRCPMAKALLGMAISEMMHLQKLSQMIVLLGGKVDYTAKFRNGDWKIWTPEYIKSPEQARQMLQADLDAERATIDQYRMHINMIADNYINDVLERIINDEEYHVMMLQFLLKEV